MRLASVSDLPRASSDSMMCSACRFSLAEYRCSSGLSLLTVAYPIASASLEETPLGLSPDLIRGRPDELLAAFAYLFGACVSSSINCAEDPAPFVSAGSLLAAMESAEQALAGHFDGPGAAFGAAPIAGFALVLVASAVAVALVRSVCDWLANAHSRIAMVVACLLRPMYSFALPAAWRTKRHALTTVDYVWDTALAHGKRGPPLLLAA